MKKITITFKEPILIYNNMRSFINCESVNTVVESQLLISARHNGVTIYLPISNILGMSVEKEN